MTSLSPRTNQWICLVVGNLTIPCAIGWKYYLGDVNVRLSIVVALISVLMFNAALLIAMRSKIKRLGQIPPRSHGVNFGALDPAHGWLSYFRSVAV